MQPLLRTCPKRVPKCRAALRLPSARRSANEVCAVLVLPGDVALQAAVSAPTPTPTQISLVPAASVVLPKAADLQVLAGLLNGAGPVALLCGFGCAGAHDRLPGCNIRDVPDISLIEYLVDNHRPKAVPPWAFQSDLTQKNRIRRQGGPAERIPSARA